MYSYGHTSSTYSRVCIRVYSTSSNQTRLQQSHCKPYKSEINCNEISVFFSTFTCFLKDFQVKEHTNEKKKHPLVTLDDSKKSIKYLGLVIGISYSDTSAYLRQHLRKLYIVTRLFLYWEVDL